MQLEAGNVLQEATDGERLVLEAIDHLLDAIERFDAPLTRELLRAAMMALVKECNIHPSYGGICH